MRYAIAVIASFCLWVATPAFSEEDLSPERRCTPIKECNCAGLGVLHAKVCLNDAFILLLRPEMAKHIDLNKVIENSKRSLVLPPEITLDDMISKVSTPEVKALLEAQKAKATDAEGSSDTSDSGEEADQTE